jgi:hypothetical protein
VHLLLPGYKNKEEQAEGTFVDSWFPIMSKYNETVAGKDSARLMQGGRLSIALYN